MRIRITTQEGEILNVPVKRIDQYNGEPAVVFAGYENAACVAYREAYQSLMGEEPGEWEDGGEYVMTLLPFNGPYKVVVL